MAAEIYEVYVIINTIIIRRRHRQDCLLLHHTQHIARSRTSTSTFYLVYIVCVVSHTVSPARPYHLDRLSEKWVTQNEIVLDEAVSGDIVHPLAREIPNYQH